MILGRAEHILDAQQPEEQHGFRHAYRIEEHLLTTNLFIDKATIHEFPVWIISLDFSKAFDRVMWPLLWQALADHGISTHLNLDNAIAICRSGRGGDWQVRPEPCVRH